MLITCQCGVTNRLPSLPKQRMHCGKCKHEFTPTELAKVRPEPAPSRGTFGGDLDDAEEQYECKDCGWEGPADDCEEDDNGKLRCPDCEKRVRRVQAFIVVDYDRFDTGDGRVTAYERYLHDVLDPRD